MTVIEKAREWAKVKKAAQKARMALTAKINKLAAQYTKESGQSLDGQASFYMAETELTYTHLTHLRIHAQESKFNIVYRELSYGTEAGYNEDWSKLQWAGAIDQAKTFLGYLENVQAEKVLAAWIA